MFVEIDDIACDSLVFQSLADTLLNFKNHINEINNGGRPAIFEWEDTEYDKEQLQKHIDAIRVVLDWYGTPQQLEQLKLAEAELDA